MHNRKQLSSQVLFSNYVPHIDISLSNLCIVILLQLLVPAVKPSRRLSCSAKATHEHS